jgi:hypothetical protein
VSTIKVSVRKSGLHLPDCPELPNACCYQCPSTDAQGCGCKRAYFVNNFRSRCCLHGELCDGAVSFFLRYSTRLTMLETSQADVLKANLHVRVSALEQLIKRNQILHRKLRILDCLHAKQEMMLYGIRDLHAASTSC